MRPGKAAREERLARLKLRLANKPAAAPIQPVNAPRVLVIDSVSPFTLYRQNGVVKIMVPRDEGGLASVNVESAGQIKRLGQIHEFDHQAVVREYREMLRTVA